MRNKHTVETALRRLDRSTNRMLEPHEGRMLRDEIWAHLDASIQARMELGETREEAERRAVQEFGDVGQVVQRVSDAQKPRGPAVSPLFTVALTAGGIVSPGIILFPRDTPGLLVLLALVGCLGTAMISTWPLRRIQWRSFIIALLPASLGFSIALSFSYRRPNVADGYRSGPELQQAIDTMRIENDLYSKYLVNLDAGYETFLREGGLQVPRDINRETGGVKYGRAKNEAAARRSWELTRSSRAEQEAGRLATEQWIRKAEEARNRTWLQEFPYKVPWGFAYALLVFAYFGAGHFSVLFLRWLYDEVGRIRRRMRRV